MIKALIYHVMIGSPSDVADDRDAAEKALTEWNRRYTDTYHIAFIPLRWEYDSAPVYGRHPQETVNREMCDKSDMLISIFWSRLGTPTDTQASGTVEEIELHNATHKPILLYFNQKGIPHDADFDQFKKLKDYKKSIQDRSMYHEYSTVDQLREDIVDHLKIMVETEEPFITDLKAFLDRPDKQNIDTSVLSNSSGTHSTIRIEGTVLLAYASKDPSGQIIIINNAEGRIITSCGKLFCRSKVQRTIALWDDVINELRVKGYIKQADHKGEIFTLTTQGFNFADIVISQMHMDFSQSPFIYLPDYCENPEVIATKGTGQSQGYGIIAKDVKKINNLSPELATMYYIMQQYGRPIALSDLCVSSSLSQRSVTVRLKELLEAGLVEKVGAGRTTKYRIKEERD